MKRRRMALGMAALALGVAGCGSEKQGPEAQAGTKTWSKADVIRLAGMRPVLGGSSYVLLDHPQCSTTRIATSAQQLHALSTADEQVVSNGDQTAGVKAPVTNTCGRYWLEAMSRVVG